MNASRDPEPDIGAVALGGTAAAASRPAPGLGFRVARNTGILAGTSLFVRFLGMVLMLFLARHLGAEGYGTYQRSEAFAFLFAVLANLGLDLILTREVARGSSRSAEYFSGTLILKSILGLLAVGAIHSVAALRGYEGDFLWGIQAFSVVLLLNAFSQALEAVFLGAQAVRYVALANLANQGSMVVFGLTCVVLGKDLRWILVAQILASTVRLLTSSTLILRTRRVKWHGPSFATLGHLLREAFPLASAAGFVIVYSQLDAVMLGEMRGNAEVGWYRAGAKFLLFFTVMRESFLLAVYPVLSNLAHYEPSRLGHLVTRVSRYLLTGAFFFVLCFVALSRLAPRLLGDDFAHSATVLPILAWLLIPQTLSILCGRVLVATNRQNTLMITAAVSLAVNVILNLLLIPRFGAVGAAISSVSSESVMAILNFWFVHRVVPNTAIARGAMKPLLAMLLTAVAMLPFHQMTLFIAFPMIVLLYVVSLALVRAFSAEEIRQGRDLLRSLWAWVWGKRPARWPMDLLRGGER